MLKYRIIKALPRILPQTKSQILWMYLVELRAKFAAKADWIVPLQDIFLNVDVHLCTEDPLYMLRFKISVESIIMHLKDCDDVFEDMLKFFEILRTMKIDADNFFFGSKF